MKKREKWPKHLGPKYQYMRRKKREGTALLAAMDLFRIGMAYLPPAEDRSAALHMEALLKWLTGPCRKAWRHQ